MILPALKTQWSPNHKARNTRLDLLVLHDCQGGYSGSINTFLVPESKTKNPVSAHLVLKEDGSEATQMVKFSEEAWHARSFNARSIGLEMAGFAEKGYGETEWQAAANILAYLAFRFNIPVVAVKPDHNGHVASGICRHFDLGRAGGNHTDPTTDNTIWNGFMQRVEKAYQTVDMPTEVWGV